MARLARPRTHPYVEVPTSCQPQSLSSKSQVKGVPSTAEPRRYPEGGQMEGQGRFGATLGTCAHPRELHPPRGPVASPGDLHTAWDPAPTWQTHLHPGDLCSPWVPAQGTCPYPMDLRPPHGALHPSWAPAPPQGPAPTTPPTTSPQEQGLRMGLGAWAPTTLVLVRAVAAVTDEVAELLSRAAAAVDDHGPTGEDGSGYGRDNGAGNPAGNQARCPQQVMEGTHDLQVTFAWAPRFGTLLGQVLSS